MQKWINRGFIFETIVTALLFSGMKLEYINTLYGHICPWNFVWSFYVVLNVRSKAAKHLTSVYAIHSSHAERQMGTSSIFYVIVRFPWLACWKDRAVTINTQEHGYCSLFSSKELITWLCPKGEYLEYIGSIILYRSWQVRKDRFRKDKFRFTCILCIIVILLVTLTSTQ